MFVEIDIYHWLSFERAKEIKELKIVREQYSYDPPTSYLRVTFNDDTFIDIYSSANRSVVETKSRFLVNQLTSVFKIEEPIPWNPSEDH